MPRQALAAFLLLSVLALASCAAPASLPPVATEDHAAHLTATAPAATDAPPPVGGARATHDARMADPAVRATHEALTAASPAMATHEAQMADPAAVATHQAQMADPAAMATHEAGMHGAPTPVPAALADTALTGFTTADFSGSGLCVMCHEALADAAGKDVSITAHWRSTMMANAAKDPFWQAKVASEVARTPGLAAAIEEKCAGCHMPMASTQARVDQAPIALSGMGFLNPGNPLHEAAMDGVSCTLCHQIQPSGLGASESFSGGYRIDASTEPPDRINFGPYPEPFGRPMQMHAGYLPAFGEHTGQAALCATCHNLFTPYVDESGVIAGEFPEQQAFTEWQNSAFGKGISCQSCHMPQAGATVISTMPPWLEPREPFFQHHFAGGNVTMVGVLAANAAELGVTATPAQLAATAQRSADQLSRAASLGLEASARTGSVLELRLRIDTATGHKLPTGFPSRRAWLHVTVKDAAGAILFESGRLSAGGAIEGNVADAQAGAFEPHYDLITAPDQVQIYEAIQGDVAGKPTYTLLRASQYLKDNRLLPAGADKTALPPEIAPHGDAATDASFSGGGDAITYQIATGSSQGPYTIEAELLYQSLAFGFRQDLTAAAEPWKAAYAALADPAVGLASRLAAIEPVSIP
jgi:hypothetical protein